MNIQELASLIDIRTFAQRTLNDVMVRMSNEEVKLLRSKITEMDRKIVEGILTLNLVDIKTSAVKEKATDKKKEKKVVENSQL